MAEGQHLRARRHKAYLVAIGGIAVFALAYIIAVSLIGTGVVRLQQPATPPPHGVAVTIVGTKVDAQKPSLDAYVVLEAHPSLADRGGELLRPLEITIEPSLDRELIYRAGRQPTVATIALPLIGDLQNFPFDTYSTRLRVNAFLLDADGAPGTPLPLAVAAEVRDPGWWGTVAVTAQAGRTSVLLGIERAGATKTISIMLLSFMVAMALVAALVAIWVVAGYVEVQVGYASWLAALLFALIPLRTFLPGAPPVGAWIDVLVFFWVEVIVMSSMLVVVLTLLVTSRRAARTGTPDPPEPPAAPTRDPDDEPPPPSTAPTRDQGPKPPGSLPGISTTT